MEQDGKKPYALLEREFEDLRKIHSSLVKGLEGMNIKMESLITENEFYKKQLVNADSRVDISKEVVLNNLQQSKEIEDNLVAEIIALKTERKKLKAEICQLQLHGEQE